MTASDSFITAFNTIDPDTIESASDFFYPANGEINVQLIEIGAREFEANDNGPAVTAKFFRYKVIDGADAGKEFRSSYIYPPSDDPAHAKAQQIALSQLKEYLGKVLDRPINADFGLGDAFNALEEKVNEKWTIEMRLLCKTKKGESRDFRNEYVRELLRFSPPS